MKKFKEKVVGTCLGLSLILIWMTGAITLLMTSYKMGSEYKEKTTTGSHYLASKMAEVFDNQTYCHLRWPTRTTDSPEFERNPPYQTEVSYPEVTTEYRTKGPKWQASLIWLPITLVAGKYATILGIIGMVRLVEGELAASTRRPEYMLEPHTCAFLCSENYKDCDFHFKAQVAHSEQVTATIANLKEDVKKEQVKTENCHKQIATTIANLEGNTKEEQGRTEECHETRDLIEIATQVENMKVGKLEEDLKKEKEKIAKCYQALGSKGDLIIGLIIWGGLSTASLIFVTCWVKLTRKVTTKEQERAGRPYAFSNSPKVFLSHDDIDMTGLRSMKNAYTYLGADDEETSKPEDNTLKK